MEYGKVPWLKVHEYLLKVESCRTKSEFFQIACAEVGKLIPFDAAVGIFSTFDGRSFHGVGLSDAADASYNDYYRRKAPSALLSEGGEHLNLDFFLSVSLIDWREFQNSEYVTDFMFPNRMYKTVTGYVPAQEIALAAHRSRLSSDFIDRDVTTLGLLNLHLNNLYKLFDRKGDPPDPFLSPQGIADRFRSLSRREAEVCSFVARRLTSAEIAILLFVSTRTVEKHIEVIYEKLDVHSREHLRRRLCLM